VGYQRHVGEIGVKIERKKGRERRKKRVYKNHDHYENVNV